MKEKHRVTENAVDRSSYANDVTGIRSTLDSYKNITLEYKKYN